MDGARQGPAAPRVSERASRRPPRLERLKRRQDFLRVAAKRNSAARPGMVLQAAHRPDDATEGSVRFGLTVSRKVGNAVERNRARRRLRAAALATLSAHGEAGVDYVLVGRRATLTRPFDKLMGDLAGAMRQVGCWRNDEAPGARAQGEAED